MTIVSPDFIDTLEAEDGQTAGSYTLTRLRHLVDSLSGMFGVTPKTTSFTFDFTQRGCVVPYNSGSAGTGTIPPNSSVAYDVGTVLQFGQMGVGAASFVAGAGVTFLTPHSLTTFGQGSIITAWQQAANIWWISGDTT
jgi:hypothetical protein